MRHGTLTRREMLRRTAAGVGALAVPGVLRAASPAAPKRPPNILFILTDDLGWGDPHCYGHPYIRTPNLDRLAKQGTLFRQFYVNNPVCSPSRTAFLTGHFPARHGVHQHFARPEQNAARGMPNWLDADVPTVCDLLKTAGYATAHFGKWHLCGGWSKDAPTPSAYGIDDHRTVNSSGPSWDQRKDPYFRAHSTGLFVDETIRFITKHRRRPWAVNLWTLVPHALLKPTPEEMKVYEGLTVDAGVFRGYMRTYAQKAPKLDAQMKVYAAAVTGMDKALGRLFAKLDELGLADNTLVVFTSDNGPEDYHVRNARNAGMGSPGPHRGRKRSIYEGGVRTSCIARWPGRVPAGRVDDESVLTGVDWLPTACALAGAEPPAGLKLDGEDVRDMLLGKPRPRRKAIFWEWRGGVAGEPAYKPPRLAVRDGKWKLLCNGDAGPAERSDVPADPAATNTLAAKHADVARRLRKRLLAWKATLPK